MEKKKRVRITNDSLNCYGTRVLTAGMDTAQYERNPVLLYMHERGEVIGYVKDLEKTETEVTGELVFDEASELSRRCKKQWEVGSLRMVSAGLDVVETSEDAALLTQGQTRPTITRSKLCEVSVVDIGANDDAIVLHKDGTRITLGKEGAALLPLLNQNSNEKRTEMEQKQMALTLGLPETATEAEIGARLGELKAAKEENEKLQAEVAALRLAGIGAAVEKAVSEKRIGSEKKDEFVSLGKEIGLERLEKVLGAMNPQVKLSALVRQSGDGAKEKTFHELSGEELTRLRREDLEEYRRLYEAEYGMKCEI